MNTIYKTGDFGKRIGVKMRTLINWDNNGTLKAKRTCTGRRYYTEAQALDYLKIEASIDNKKVIIYCRVSTRNQKDDLKNQENYIINYCKNEGKRFDEIVTDIGSGLNYNRKEFNKILERVEKKEIKEIIITHKDRFIRFGFNWFESFCRSHECILTILDNTDKDIHTELVDDLISIIHVFSCRLYGLRNYKKKTNLEKLVENEIKNANTQNKILSR